MNLKIIEKIAVLLTKAIILIVGFILYIGLTYGLLNSTQKACDTISQTKNIIQLQ